MNKKKEIIIKQIDEWMDRNDYPFRNQEDLVEGRTDYDDLKEKALEAYYLLLDIKFNLL